MKKRSIAIVMLLMIGLSGCASEKFEEQKAEPTATPTATIQVKELPEESYLTIEDQVYTATGGALQITVPEDWRVNQEDKTIVLAGKEKDTKDFVSVQVWEKEPKFEEYTEKHFEEYYNSIFDNYQVVDFTKTTVQGLPAFCLQYTFSKDDTDITAYEYMIDGNATYSIVFTDVSGNLKDEIEGILDSVVICK